MLKCKTFRLGLAALSTLPGFELCKRNDDILSESKPPELLGSWLNNKRVPLHKSPPLWASRSSGDICLCDELECVPYLAGGRWWPACLITIPHIKVQVLRVVPRLLLQIGSANGLWPRHQENVITTRQVPAALNSLQPSIIFQVREY